MVHRSAMLLRQVSLSFQLTEGCSSHPVTLIVGFSSSASVSPGLPLEHQTSASRAPLALLMGRASWSQLALGTGVLPTWPGLRESPKVMPLRPPPVGMNLTYTAAPD